jgi:hypothetical protein
LLPYPRWFNERLRDAAVEKALAEAGDPSSRVPPATP